MKVYVLEYIFKTPTLSKQSDEKRIETFTDITKFIDRVKYVISPEHNYYMINPKTYVGNAEEIDVEKVINPF